MDKPRLANSLDDYWDIVLDLMEHPRKFSAEQIDDILSNARARELYNLLCETTSALAANEPVPDVDAQWRRFSQQNPASHAKVRFLRFKSRHAAAAAILIAVSVAVFAAGIAVSQWVRRADSDATEIARYGHSTAYAHGPEAVKDTVPETVSAITGSDDTMLFEDAPLGAILETVARKYGVTVRFTAPALANLRLYYRFNPELPLSDVIDQLNTFEQINITLDGETLSVSNTRNKH